MDGFFVFGFALTMTPVAGPSPPFRFSTSLIFGQTGFDPFDPTLPMILGSCPVGKDLSITPHAEFPAERQAVAPACKLITPSLTLVECAGSRGVRSALWNGSRVRSAL